MAGLEAFVGPQHLCTGEVKIADGIEDLMAHEFVGVTQAVFVEHAELVQHDGVVHRTAQAQVALAHVFQVAHETEGTGARDFLDIGGGGEIDLRARLLGRNHRVVKLDGEAQLVAFIRGEAGDLVAFGDFHRLEHADEALRCVLLGDAGGLQQEHERTRGTIHDRQFGRGQFHDDVVHTQAGQRRHQVFNGLDLGVVAGEAGAQGHFGDQVGTGRDFDDRVQVHAAEHDAMVDRSRAQGHVDLVTAVQANAGGADRVLESALRNHGGRPGSALSARQ